MNTFLDPYLADEAKQKAMAQVFAAAPEKWKSDAFSAVLLLAYLKPEFTSDDVWTILYKPPESRALGPVMASAARRGFIERAWKQARTAQVSRHHTDVNIWRSLVYGSEAPPGWGPVLQAWGKTLNLAVGGSL